MASIDVNLTAMDSWCNLDCAVALTQVGGVQTVIVSLYQRLDVLMQMIVSEYARTQAQAHTLTATCNMHADPS